MFAHMLSKSPARRRLRTLAATALLGVSAACTPDESTIELLEPGALTVAVTTENPTSEFEPQLWIRRYVEAFAADQALTIRWVVVPFNESWLLASNDEVDLVATNVANFPDRASEGASWSAPFLYEQRALRIRPEDADRFGHINDFIGHTVGVVNGMAAERDVDRRAPEGVNVYRTQSFKELYDEFDAGNLDAIAEAEYFALDGEIIPSYGDDVLLIDHHDLNPGQREESVFVVRDRSRGLLEAINAFIAKTPFPL